MRSHFLLSSPGSSASFASISVPLPRARPAGDDGEREDGGPGAGEEGDGEGEGEGDQSRRIFIEGRPAAGLDPGRLDPLEICQADLDDLADGGLIPHGSARLPGKESEPQPQEGECVLLATHVDRGFSLPPHPFFDGF